MKKMGPETQPTVHIHRTERPNSFEFGPAGARHKVFYEKPEELEELVLAVKRAVDEAERKYLESGPIKMESN